MSMIEDPDTLRYKSLGDVLEETIRTILRKELEPLKKAIRGLERRIASEDMNRITEALEATDDDDGEECLSWEDIAKNLAASKLADVMTTHGLPESIQGLHELVRCPCSITQPLHINVSWPAGKPEEPTYTLYFDGMRSPIDDVRNTKVFKHMINALSWYSIASNSFYEVSWESVGCITNLLIRLNDTNFDSTLSYEEIALLNRALDFFYVSHRQMKNMPYPEYEDSTTPSEAIKEALNPGFNDVKPEKQDWSGISSFKRDNK